MLYVQFFIVEISLTLLNIVAIVVTYNNLLLMAHVSTTCLCNVSLSVSAMTSLNIFLHSMLTSSFQMLMLGYDFYIYTSFLNAQHIWKLHNTSLSYQAILNFEEQEQHSKSPRPFDPSVLESYLLKTLPSFKQLDDYKSVNFCSFTLHTLTSFCCI